MNINENIRNTATFGFDSNSNVNEEKEKDLIKTEHSNIDTISINDYQKSMESTGNNLNNNKLSKKSKSILIIENQINNKFSLDNLGDIELAKDHRSANRPLNKIKEFNKKTKFCQCCNLPCEQKGVIEPFKYHDSVKDFSICGKGIYLYFFYISYAVCCNLIIIFLSSITFNISSNKYYKNVLNLCNINDSEIKFKCENYKNINKDLNLNDVNFFYKLSVDAIKSYRDLCIDLIGDNKICDKSIINYSIINFFCMLSLLFFNIVCLYVFHYINNKLKIGILPSDYTLLITDLYKYYEDFIKINIKNKFNIDEFVSYLKEQLFDSISANKDMSKNIHSINICYKIKEYIEKQKKCEEYKYKIFQILNNPYQKKKNEKLQIFNEEEKCYFLMPFTLFGCLCSLKKKDKLKDLKNKKNKKEIE